MAKGKKKEISGTRLELTLAAEKVFALNGIAGATHRQIREAAGQKNESVINYHFGSTDAIIESILQLRTTPINKMRQGMLAQARAESTSQLVSTEQVMRSLLMPLAHYVLDSNEPGYYLRFLVQLRTDRTAWRKFSGIYDRGLVDCLSALRDAKPYLPIGIVNQRYMHALTVHLVGLAAIEQIKCEKGPGFRLAEGWVRVEDLITITTALCDAPLSHTTIDALQRAAEHHPVSACEDSSCRRALPD